MRSPRLLPLLAAALVAAPLVSASTSVALAGPALSAASAQQAGTAAAVVTQRVQARPVHQVTRRLARPAAKPAAKPVAKPAAKPVAKPAVKPVTRPAGTSSPFAFLHVEAGAPVRWNPCGAVPWTFDPAGAPAGGLAAVQAALAEVGRRTGLSFSYQGTTTEVPTARYLSQSWGQFKPLLVGWTTADRSDLLAGRTATTVGMTRVLWTGSYDDKGVNRTQIASGVVAFNRATSAPATGAGSWYAYALHELGHAVGLAHVDDASQVMNPVISRSVTGYGAGDVVGLRGVGSAGGCLPAIR